jgi:alkaline phosphatase
MKTTTQATRHRGAVAAVLLAAGAVALGGARAKAQEVPSDWFFEGRDEVETRRTQRTWKGRAKNVILFVGDGMGISTVTAARILEGQLEGGSGEENRLYFENFPHAALSRVYQVNQQTPDSAPTMTAMVTGVKTDEGVLSVDQDVVHNDHTTVAGNELKTILEIAEERGLSTGIVSTARITHATPAACYAHTCNRDWESNNNMTQAARDAGFSDIARQLIEFPYGDGPEVVLGGGRSKFLPTTTPDPEDAGRFGERTDGRDLTQEWLARYGNDGEFVWKTSQFENLDPDRNSHILGLFERSHMEYEADRATDTGGEPSLADMTELAISVLSKNKNGYFLHVEAGRIDHAHHAGNAYRALTDTLALADAVKRAVQMSNMNQTLIVVTADHGHVFTIGGYPTRGNPILGKVRSNLDGGVVNPDFDLDMLGLPYTTLGYQNGPGYTGASNSQPEGVKTNPHIPSSYSGITSGRPDLTLVDTAAPNFLQEAAVPLASETHSGEDVGIYARGPGSSLFSGVMQQNSIFHAMARALRFEDEITFQGGGQ